MSAQPKPSPEEWEEYTYEASRFFRAVLIAILISIAMWAGLFYLSRWIWHVVWALWRLWA